MYVHANQPSQPVVAKGGQEHVFLKRERRRGECLPFPLKETLAWWGGARH